MFGKLFKFLLQKKYKDLKLIQIYGDIMENFKPRARLLKLLGEELIGSQHLALFELIKNAYDADADNVVINIHNIDNMKSTIISIKDNGCGMTLDTIRNSWLEPGTDRKDGRKQNIHRKVSQASIRF